jgi:hypothetical protein
MRTHEMPMSPGVGGQILQAKLTGLMQEHRDLDGAISALFGAGSCDPLLIARLKKRKLYLKDKIARLGGTYKPTPARARA